MQGDGTSTVAGDCNESGRLWLLGSEGLGSQAGAGWSQRLGWFRRWRPERRLEGAQMLEEGVSWVSVNQAGDGCGGPSRALPQIKGFPCLDPRTRLQV